jgi:hypothetical protein
MRISGTGYSVYEAIQRGVERGKRESAMFDLCIMDTAMRRRLAFELSDRVRYVDVMASGSATVGFKAIEFVDEGSRPIAVMEDANCQPNKIWLLTKDSWEFDHINGLPDMWDEGGQLQVLPAEWGFEVRADLTCLLRCKSPKDNLVINM